MKDEFGKSWRPYEPFIKAIVDLFHPFVEAAVHDLSKGKLVAIYHNISQRKVGDSSPLHELKVSTNQFPDYFDPYYKRNWGFCVSENYKRKVLDKYKDNSFFEGPLKRIFYFSRAL